MIDKQREKNLRMHIIDLDKSFSYHPIPNPSPLIEGGIATLSLIRSRALKDWWIMEWFDLVIRLAATIGSPIYAVKRHILYFAGFGIKWKSYFSLSLSIYICPNPIFIYLFMSQLQSNDKREEKIESKRRRTRKLQRFCRDISMPIWRTEENIFTIYINSKKKQQKVLFYHAHYPDLGFTSRGWIYCDRKYVVVRKHKAPSVI